MIPTVLGLGAVWCPGCALVVHPRIFLSGADGERRYGATRREGSGEDVKTLLL
jgi:hypothetical protein